MNCNWCVSLDIDDILSLMHTVWGKALQHCLSNALNNTQESWSNLCFSETLQVGKTFPWENKKVMLSLQKKHMYERYLSLNH